MHAEQWFFALASNRAFAGRATTSTCHPAPHCRCRNLVVMCENRLSTMKPVRFPPLISSGYQRVFSESNFERDIFPKLTTSNMCNQRAGTRVSHIRTVLLHCLFRDVVRLAPEMARCNGSLANVHQILAKSYVRGVNICAKAQCSHRKLDALQKSSPL